MATAEETNGLDEALAILSAEFTSWRFWRSREGRMVCATLVDKTAGISPTLVEDSVEELRDALEREQAAARRPFTPGRMGL